MMTRNAVTTVPVMPMMGAAMAASPSPDATVAIAPIPNIAPTPSATSNPSALKTSIRTASTLTCVCIVLSARPTNHDPRITTHEPRTTTHEPRPTNHESRPTNHEPRPTNHDPRNYDSS